MEQKAATERNQITQPNGYVSRNEQSLSKTEAYILYLIQQDPYASSETLAMRYKQGTSGAYIRKIRGKLRHLGLLALVTPPQVTGGGDSVTPVTKTRRLHAVKLRIDLINPIGEKYLREYNKKLLTLKGCDIQCFNDCLCIQMTGQSFWGTTEDEAIAEAYQAIKPLLRILEHDMGTMLTKDRKNNIHMTYDEWATNPSGTATEAIKRGNQIRIYSEDGKLRFTTDRSMGFEHETHDARTAKPDSEQYNKHVADFLDHKEAPTLSELAKIVGALATQNSETAAGLNAIVKLMQKPTLQSTPNMETDRRYVG